MLLNFVQLRHAVMLYRMLQDYGKLKYYGTLFNWYIA